MKENKLELYVCAYGNEEGLEKGIVKLVYDIQKKTIHQTPLAFIPEVQ